MSKPIYLKLDTNKGIVTLPFLGIKEVDSFTVKYHNKGELIGTLIKLLNLQLDLYDVTDVYLTYDKYNRGLNGDCFCVKYRGDNFNFQSLFDAFVTYIRNNPDRILSTGLRYVKAIGILRYFDTGLIDNYELERAVRAYFENNTAYKKMRDSYFLIKEIMDEENIKVKIDKIDDGDTIERDDLSVHSNGEDDYLSYLIELSKKGEREFEIAMDEIGQADLEDINRLLRSNGYGIVDGVSENSQLMRGQISLLEETTGISIDGLRTNHVGFGRKLRRRK